MEPALDLRTRQLFGRALDALVAAEVPFIVAGSFALNHYTGRWRDTKDLDVFVRPRDAGAALDALAAAGFRTRFEESHWLGKAELEQRTVDVIWGGGNWATQVDDHWFEHGRPGRLLGRDVLFAPPGDIILSKAYVAGRERYDGTDIAVLIHACGHEIDWDDLVARFGDHWALLLQYLVLYRFVYPRERDVVPASLIHELAARIGTTDEVSDGLAFRGLLVDRYAYLHDVVEDGREDPREIVAVRLGIAPDSVVRRRYLDGEALAAGRVYGPPCQHGDELADEVASVHESPYEEARE